MYNEPITFDPALREIAREVSALVTRVRVALRARNGREWPAADTAA